MTRYMVRMLPGWTTPDLIEVGAEPIDIGPMQATIGGGYIELFHRVAVADGRALDFFADEDGKSKRLAPNRYCTHRREGIVGPILVAASDAEGETYGLTEAEVAHAVNVISAWPEPGATGERDEQG